MADMAKIEIKNLTRKDMKALREAKLDPAFTKFEQEQSADFVDFILDLKYKDIEAQLDEMPYYELVNLATNTYKKAMTGTVDELKN